MTSPRYVSKLPEDARLLPKVPSLMQAPWRVFPQRPSSLQSSLRNQASSGAMMKGLPREGSLPGRLFKDKLAEHAVQSPLGFCFLRLGLSQVLRHLIRGAGLAKGPSDGVGTSPAKSQGARLSHSWSFVQGSRFVPNASLTLISVRVGDDKSQGLGCSWGHPLPTSAPGACGRAP